MLQNNNRNSVNKLSKKSLKANKMRNVCAILAIILTTILITITISGGMTFYKTNKIYDIVSNYNVNCDGYLNINKESEKKLNSVDNVDKVGIIQLASVEGVKNKELLNENIALESVKNKIAFDMMAVVPIEGSYPKKPEEVFVPTWILEVLEIEKKVGGKINLDVEINGEVKTIECVLSGYYESLVPRGSNQTKIFVSNEFIEKYNSEIIDKKNTKVAFITLKNLNDESSFKTAKDEIQKIGQKIGALSYKANPKYDKEENGMFQSDNMEQVIAISVGLLIVMITGYLIIYNIFHISVAKDIRFYGLLKTIGTTSKQLKKIILKQAIKLSIIGIPIGLILGYIVSIIIIPMALEFTIFGNIAVVSHSLSMFLVSTIFSLITVLISCNKPARAAGKVSPIEAVRYVVSDNKSKKKVKKGAYGAKIYKMAWSNIIKNKKRVILSILSISLSALTVIFTVNATMGLDPKKHADAQMTADIKIRNLVYNGIQSGKGYEPITEEFIEKIKELDMVENVTPYYSGITPEKDGTIITFSTKIKIDEKFKKELQSYGDPNKKYTGFNFYPREKNTIFTSVRALKADMIDKEVENLKIIDGSIDKEKFKKGNYIIYYPTLEKDNSVKAGDALPLTFEVVDENGNLKEAKKDFKVMAVVSRQDGEFASNNLKFLNIEESAFKEIFSDYKNYVDCLNIKLKDGTDIKKADEVISKLIIESGNSSLELSSKNFFIEGLKSIKVTFLAIGAIISGILGLIGIINVMNTVLTGIFSRRVEFAMLESIGMTKKQLKKMILFEGLYYIVLSSLLIIPLGITVSCVAPMMLPIYGGLNISLCIISILVAITIIAILIMIIPIIGYKLVSRESIVERLNFVE